MHFYVGVHKVFFVFNSWKKLKQLLVCVQKRCKKTVVFNEMKDKGLYFDIVYSTFVVIQYFFLLNDIPT